MIYAHIVGLTQQQKNDIYKKYNIDDYVIKDLDDITDNIMIDKYMLELIKKYEYYINKTKTLTISKLIIKQLLNKSRVVNTKINNYWKTRMEFYINEFMNNKNNQYILIGYSNFYRNIRTFVNIKSNIRIFIHLDMNKYTKDIITTNIDTYRDDIINGNFNIDLLNPTFLITRRVTIENMYIKKQYESKSFEESFIFLNNIKVNYDIPEILFYCSTIKYNSHIPIKELIAYSDEWISIISFFKNFKFIKGYINNNYNKPFIQESIKNTLSQTNIKLYLYIITNTDLFIPIFTKNYIYKYKSNNNVQILKVIEIENALNRLKELNISLVTI